MTTNVSLPWDTGYSLLMLLGAFFWVGVPVINSAFNVSVMTTTQSIPFLGTYQFNVALGGGLIALGTFLYLGNRTGWW